MLNMPVLQTSRLFIRPFKSDDPALQGVMRRLGMQTLRNPYPKPAWLQVVGALKNPACRGRLDFAIKELQAGFAIQS